MKRNSLILNLIIAAAVLLVVFTGSSGLNGSETPPAENSGVLEVRFLDVGQADASLVTCGGHAMLIDGGNTADSSFIFSYLKSSGIGHLDYAVCTHPHEDHAGGLAAALNACSVGTILAPVTGSENAAFQNLVKYADEQGLSITVPDAGDSFTLGDAQVTVIGPLKEYENENDTSIVLKVVFGETSFLFTGDAEREAELDMTDSGADLKSTVLKVCHHGSGTSSSYVFLRAVMPEYAVISVGDGNPYAHPHDDVMSRLRDVGAKVYRTDMQGTVTAVSDGSTVIFRTERNEDAVTNPTEAAGEGAGYYIGNKKSLTFHLPTCPSLPKEENRVTFDSRSDAVSQGYKPCGTCRP